MTTLSKVCCRCQCTKPVSEFYQRRGGTPTSWCKPCMKEAAKDQQKKPRLNAWESRVHSENVALAKLTSMGIWAQPGKSCSAAHVDVVARGCVYIEVKYARLSFGTFTFTTTTSQVGDGLRADLVMLVCDYEDDRGRTYHLLPADHDVFYMHPHDPAQRRLKTGIVYQPGQTKHKHAGNRVLLDDALMQSARDQWHLVDDVRTLIESRIMQGLPPR